jgi:WD40 repeat protein
VAKHLVNKVLTPPTCYGRSLAISPDGKLLAKSWCPDTTEGKVDLQLWDIAIGEILLTIEGHEPEYNSLDISPNGQILVSAGYGTVRLWDVETGKALMVLDVPNVSSVTFSPDGTLLATDGDIVRLWGIPAH